MNSKKEVQHVYLVGAKSLGAYGGYETFVYKLTEYHQNKENIKYHVACKANGDGCMDESKFDGVTKINEHEFELHNAHCFKIDVPQIGPAQAIYYDVAALKACCEHIKKNHIPHPIVYIMACRIGPFAGHFYREIHKLGGTVYLNPDGLAAVSSSFFAALCSAFGRYDVVHLAFRHLIDFLAVQHQVGCKSVWLIKTDLLICDRQRLIQRVQVHKNLMLQIMSQSIPADHLLCLRIKMTVDKYQWLIKVE